MTTTERFDPEKHGHMAWVKPGTLGWVSRATRDREKLDELFAAIRNDWPAFIQIAPPGSMACRRAGLVFDDFAEDEYEAKDQPVFDLAPWHRGILITFTKGYRTVCVHCGNHGDLTMDMHLDTKEHVLTLARPYDYAVARTWLMATAEHPYVEVHPVTLVDPS